jgi:hypothetical protein
MSIVAGLPNQNRRWWMPSTTGRRKRQMFDAYFKLTENGTNVRTEVLAGATTFLAMA